MGFYKTGGKEVLVPYRGIYFLYDKSGNQKTQEAAFSSPIGESIFSTGSKMESAKQFKRFSSPIGESIFSTGESVDRKRSPEPVLVPYRGIYFLYRNNLTTTPKVMFSSPIGESIFSTLPLEPLCLSGFQSCFAGQNLKFVFLLLFPMLAVLFSLF